jgi:hypothetical protein
VAPGLKMKQRKVDTHSRDWPSVLIIFSFDQGAKAGIDLSSCVVKCKCLPFHSEIRDENVARPVFALRVISAGVAYRNLTESSPELITHGNKVIQQADRVS